MSLAGTAEASLRGGGGNGTFDSATASRKGALANPVVRVGSSAEGRVG
jgi:hypothetical protein